MILFFIKLLFLFTSIFIIIHETCRLHCLKTCSGISPVYTFCSSESCSRTIRVNTTVEGNISLWLNIWHTSTEMNWWNTDVSWPTTCNRHTSQQQFNFFFPSGFSNNYWTLTHLPMIVFFLMWCFQFHSLLSQIRTGLVYMRKGLWQSFPVDMDNILFARMCNFIIFNWWLGEDYSPDLKIHCQDWNTKSFFIHLLVGLK